MRHSNPFAYGRPEYDLWENLDLIQIDHKLNDADLLVVMAQAMEQLAGRISEQLRADPGI